MKSIQRAFIPGSKWVYIKLYLGNNTADKVLIDHISYIVTGLKKKGIIDKWFFIRYTDPDFHLRIRLLVENESSIGDILNMFYKRLSPLVKDNLIWKIQLDTYNRELERYGNKSIELAESIFYYDSECILSILKKVDNDNYRWMIALKMIDSLLSDFSFNINAKKDIMDKISNSFKIEFGFNQYNAKQFNTKYRDNKKNIEDVLNDTIKDTKFKALYLPIQKKTKNLKPIIDRLNNTKNIDENSLISSYIHMMLNRLFQSKNRIHELVLYDFMKRYYISELAKLKYSK